MIDTILGLIAFGSLGFWLLALVVSAVIIGCTEKQYYWVPSFLTLGMIALYWKTFAAILDLRALIVLVVGYLAIGTVWSIFRWFRFTRSVANIYMQKHGAELSIDSMAELKQDVNVNRHKARISGWIAYWPWSLFWNIAGDVISTLFESVQNIYANLSNRQLNKFSVKQVTRSQPPQPNWARS